MADTRDAFINALLDRYVPQESGTGSELTTADVLSRMPQPSWHDRFIKPLGSAAMTARGPWMRGYLPETLANFLGNALQTAPLGFPAARFPQPGARPPLPSAEWPMHAAVRIGDRTFKGSSHFDAVTKAQEALGENALATGSIAADGFLTNQGRYVSREEAGRMLDDLNKTRHYRTWLGSDKKGKAGLLSEALELYDPTTGRQK